MVERPDHSLRFADGTTLPLGRRTCVLGILNTTPDSFSDGGLHAGLDAALAAAQRMESEGADWIDIGGESTRPGAVEVEIDEEIRRVVPVIEGLRRRSAIRISIDTRKAAVAEAALDAGADVINDVSALSDPGMAALAARRGVPIVLMHMRGTPETMQGDTRYGDVTDEVVAFLGDRANAARNAGVADDRIVLDPGIGFGKSAAGSLRLLRDLAVFRRIGRPILIGASRKSFIGKVTDLDVDERLEASLAVAAHAVSQGAHLIRAHDVRPTRRAVDIMDAMHRI